MKQILLPTKVRAELKKTFKIANYTVLRDYLTFKSNSGTAKVVRAAALQRGGLIYTGAPTPMPACEMRFFYEDNMMVQQFGDRVWINVYFDDDANIDLLVDDEMVESHNDLSITDFMRLQERAEKKANELLNQ